MNGMKKATWSGMSAQTSVGGVSATNSGHRGEQSFLRVPRGHTSGMAGLSHISYNATPPNTKTTSQSTLSRTGAFFKAEEASRLCSPKPDNSTLRKNGPKRSSEGMKAKAQYKAALKIRIRLQDKVALSVEEKEQLTWAEQRIEESRLHFAKLPNMASTGGFANKVEEMLANKRQRPAETAIKDAPVIKRQHKPKEAVPTPNAKKPNRKAETKVSEVPKRHLIVALIDRGDENGMMTEARWKTVHARLVESLFARMEKNPKAPMPTFDGAGWLNGVKILKCLDDPTLKWLKQTVCQLKGLWEGAKLEVVGRESIPSRPKAKVLFPIAIQRDQALKLLQRQNPDVPTADWQILHLTSPLSKEGGQSAILQINKEAEDILYPRYGKMAWGMGSVYLRLKKRHPGDMDAHTLQAGEVEKDLGLNTTADVAQVLTLNESDDEDDGDQIFIVNTSSGDEHSTRDHKGAVAYPP